MKHQIRPHQIGLPLVPRTSLEQYVVLEGYDSRFAANARLLQSIWREKKGFPVGHHRDEAGQLRPMGSRLPANIAFQGHNFVAPEIAKLVRREAAYREIGALFDEERLWGNLLSSQPLTFNLFGKAKLDLKFGKKLLKSVLPNVEGDLETVLFEHSPGRGDRQFTGDGTAFDVAFVLRKPSGRSIFIGVEVKYSETMRTPKRPFNERTEALASKAAMHKNPTAPELRAEPISQLFAEHLLAFAVVHEAQLYDEGLFVLVIPKDNREAARASNAYRQTLDIENDKLPFLTVEIEQVIGAIATHGEPQIAARLAERYTDFSPVHALIDDWEPYRD